MLQQLLTERRDDRREEARNQRIREGSKTEGIEKGKEEEGERTSINNDIMRVLKEKNFKRASIISARSVPIYQVHSTISRDYLRYTEL
jgi:hypothetical protein